MKLRSLIAASVPLVLVLAASARADDKPNVKEILEKADAATKALKAVSYEAEFHGEEYLADRTPRISGKVISKKGRQGLLTGVLGGPRNLLRFDCQVRMPGSDEDISFLVATDGKQAYKINRTRKEFAEGELPEAIRLLTPVLPLRMQEYVHPTPFSDEIEAKKQTYEGTKDINGVECDVVYIVYRIRNAAEARWFFGKDDHLPRRVERITRSAGEDDDAPRKRVTVLTVKNLNTNPEIKNDAFVLKEPAGYKQPNEAELLSVGARAPDWDLKNSQGSKVTLKSLRGNVVLLDFWATWCGPCRLAMPGVQKLHEEFKDRPVRVFGVNCSETGDPAEFMKNKGFTYGLLLDGDRIADKYKVSGLPTFYVIDGNGKVIYAAVGFDPDIERNIAQSIRDGLKTPISSQ